MPIFVIYINKVRENNTLYINSYIIFNKALVLFRDRMVQINCLYFVLESIPPTAR